MAYNTVNNNIQNRKIIGYSLPFNTDNVFNPTYTTKEQIKTNIINYFNTNKGERVFNPFFGSNLRKFLFEQIIDENLELLISKIKSDFKIYFPNVKLEDIKVNTNKDKNFFEVKITYHVIKLNIIEDIDIIVK